MSRAKDWMLGALIIAMMAGEAQAAIVNQGTFLTDTTSGLDWLDMASTYDLTFDQVVSELAPNGPLAGWSVATNAQVFQLALDAGSPALPVTDTPLLVAFNGAGALTTLVGDLGVSVLAGSVYGFNAEPGNSAGAEGISKFLLYNANTQSLGDSVSYIPAGDPVNNPQAWVGTYLVRETAAVPEPSTLVLALVGLCLLIWMRMRTAEASTAKHI